MKDKLTFHTKELIDLFASSSDVENYFSTEIQWLKQRLSIWEQQTWRVALIGLTSSGKSTLVNALLTDRLLPTRVRPSSNSLVICRWGKEAKALIHYEDKPSEYVGPQMLATRFSELTDEEKNPDNVKGVKEIELYWPSFKLGKNVALVDTPGLDAYQLERHEELTMQLLLPTVDAVIFLTTAKANADSRIAGYLDIIGSHAKPVILVQNMIDSIEPKLGTKGIVVRSKTEVADDHRKRLRKLLDRGHESVKKAPIVQVSAEWALQGKLKKSKIPSLVKTVNESVDILMPRLVKGRYQQLITELSKIIKREDASSSVACSQDYFLSEKERLRGQNQKVATLLQTFNSDITCLLGQARAQASKIKTDAKNLKAKDCNEAMQIKRQVEKWFMDTPKLLGQVTSDFQKNGRELAAELNLSVEDLRMEKTKSPTRHSINIHINSQQKTKKTEKSGFFSGMARFFGLGGYDYKTIEFHEVDVNAFRKEVNRLSEAEIIWIIQASTTLEKHAQVFVLPLNNEIDRCLSNLEKKQQLELKAEKRLEIVNTARSKCRDLEKDLTSVQTTDSKVEDRCAKFTGIQIDIELPRYVHSLFALSHQISSKRFLTMRELVLSRVSKKNSIAAKRTLIWSFDGDSLDRFINRFFFDSVIANYAEKKSFKQITGSPVFDEIAVALDAGELKNKGVAKCTRRFLGIPSTIFLMLDIEQPGATMSQVSRSEILPFLNDASGLVIVVQGVQGLENSGQLSTGIRELKNMVKTLNLKVDGVLVNDQKPVVTALVDRLYRKGDELKTMEDEKRWIFELSGSNQKIGRYIGNLLRNWSRDNQMKGGCA